MQMYDEETGISITLEYDGDGFPLVSIDLGGSYYSDDLRPTIDVEVNGVVIHEMFAQDDDDTRWKDANKQT